MPNKFSIHRLRDLKTPYSSMTSSNSLKLMRQPMCINLDFLVTWGKQEPNSRLTFRLLAALSTLSKFSN
jgi:hypothetical protein